jgi:hypothetical protein
MNIYSLTSEYKLIEAQLLDEECDQESFQKLLDSVKADINNKILNYAFVIKNLENTLNGINEAIGAMCVRQKQICNKIETLKEYTLKAMNETGINKIESDYFNVSVRNNMPKVIIDNESKIPEEFLRVKTIIEPDKIRIKDFLSSGEVLAGAHLEANKSLQIK